MEHHEAPQQPLVHHPKLWEEGFVAIFGVVQQVLDGDEILPGDNGFVMVAVKALGPVAFILLGFVGEVVGGKGFSGEHVPAVAFVAQHLHHRVGRPPKIAQICFPSLACEDFRNLAGGIAVKVQVKNQLYRGGFFGVDHQIPFAVVGIPQQLGSQRQSTIQTHPQGSLHAPAAGVGFLLSHGGLERQSHLGIILQGENALAFKEHPHRGGQFAEHPHGADAVHHVPGEAGDTFGEDQVNLPSLAICNHLVELFPMGQGGAADSLIGVDARQSPVGVAADVILVILFLKLVGGGLLHIPGGHPGVDSHRQPGTFPEEVSRFFGREERVILLVNLRVDFPAHTFLLGEAVVFRGFMRHAVPPLQGFLDPAGRGDPAGLLGSKRPA